MQDTKSDASSASDSMPVHHVSVKPPPFMETAVRGWFAILDAQFHIARITNDQTKFYHVLSSLPPETIARIPQDVLAKKEFDSLKESVTDTYEKTKPELFERLISRAHLTGRPSLFLSELREIADKVGVGDELIRHKFLQSLPAGIAAALGSQRELSLSQLGKLADELLPLVQGSRAAGSVNAVNVEAEPLPQPSGAMFSPVLCFMTPTQPRYPSDPRRHPARAPVPARAQDVSIGLTPYYDGQRPQVCRAHLFFGTRARTCKPWCKWPSKAADLTVQPSSRSASPARVPQQGN